MPNPNLNKVFLIGRLTRDPELRYTSSGQAVTTCRLAVNREYSAKTGEKKEETCYVNLVVWGKRAEVAAEFLKKGNLIFAEGRLNYRTWENNDSEKRSVLEVVVENFQFLEKPNVDIIEEKEDEINGKNQE
ncbi:MAG TPA: single-stranded DNA-binding protein [Candidatus Ratteibacteria bacterium]|nr:single-stranded DNA-binding protein [bacterium]HRR96823.1 single-stranded DNA-binding protein [Candidatus Ratteibacteria bacterium]